MIDSLDSIDIELIKIFQEDILLVEEPFKLVADDLRISEEEVIKRLKKLKDEGILRRIGAVLYHREAGFKANAMVVWKVDKKDVDRIGSYLASIKEVTHCYERKVCKEWQYNLFSMIHGEDRNELKNFIKHLSNKIGIENFKILYSTKELKKTSMKYKYR